MGNLSRDTIEQICIKFSIHSYILRVSCNAHKHPFNLVTKWSKNMRMRDNVKIFTQQLSPGFHIVLLASSYGFSFCIPLGLTISTGVATPRVPIWIYTNSHSFGLDSSLIFTIRLTLVLFWPRQYNLSSFTFYCRKTILFKHVMYK